MKVVNILQFKTKRLLMRPLVLRDYKAWQLAHLGALKPQNKWDTFYKKLQDLTFLNYKKLVNKQKLQRKKENIFSFAVFDIKSKKLLGSVLLINVIASRTSTAELGYHIFNNHWGKGYAKEAVKALIKKAFTDFKLHRLEAFIQPENRRSVMLARSLKMRHEGHRKKMILINKKWSDVTVYAITCEELGYKWRGRRY